MLTIQTFGGFRMSSGIYSIEESDKKAPKFWKTLQYLVSFRHRPVSSDELLTAVWDDDERSNPKNSMHNMMFRIRTVLSESGILSGKEVFIRKGGSYVWNDQLDYVVDCETFEKLYNQSNVSNISNQDKLEMLLHAIELFKGEYLPSINVETWVIPIASYYRSIYIECVHNAVKLLMEQDKFLEAEMVCNKALLINPSDEKIHEHHLQAIIKQGKQIAVIDEYNKKAAWFNKNLGVLPPESLRALYMDVLRATGEMNRPLMELSKEWIEQADDPGAFYCEYGVFRIIYQIEARSVLRSGKSVYIFSISVAEEAGEREQIKESMLNLYKAIQSSFRKEDVFTRVATSQFLLMLKGLSFEKCEMLSRRLTRRYLKLHGAFPLTIEIKPIVPVNW